MKVKHIKNSLIAKCLRVDGITIYPFVFYSKKNPDKILMSHEMIHVKQVRYHGWIRFYVSYFLEYLSYLARGDSSTVAYNKISYEKEAYGNQKTYSGDYN